MEVMKNALIVDAFIYKVKRCVHNLVVEYEIKKKSRANDGFKVTE